MLEGTNKEQQEIPDNDNLVVLISAISTGDEAALTELYDFTVTRVYRLAYAMTGNDADAEEIVGDVYMQVWRRAQQYDARRGSVMTWLMINCRSLSLDLLRRRRARQTGQEKLAAQQVEIAELLSAEALVNLLHEGSAVRQALKQLSEMQQQMIALAFFRDMSHSEIAATVQLPLGTVKSHINRGLQKLREYIQR